MTLHPHTPGPWNVDEDDLSIFADVGTAICTVMDVEDFPCVEEGTEDDVAAECRANALLIAAAPTLLQAVKGLLEATERGLPRAFAEEYAEAAVKLAEGLS